MHDDLISVGSLHALVYCERLFYLEEVERIRVADEAVSVAQSRGAAVCESFAHLVRAQVWRGSARGVEDRQEARSAIAAGLAVAKQTGAATWAAFLAEERTRLDGGDLVPVADCFDAIGATGHARRIREEIGA